MGILRPDSAGYQRDLEAVRAGLAPTAERVAIRGAGLARFVWAEAAGRSVEVSWDEAGICVEFWERGANSESRQELHPSYEQVVEAARAWLGS